MLFNFAVTDLRMANDHSLALEGWKAICSRLVKLLKDHYQIVSP